ncbi:MAG: hpxZ [Acidimicrobiia bacterium]|nr:hpxZ [Acidimicrobiia bacterium]
MNIDDPAVTAQVRTAFERYETALLANDLAALDEMFWPDSRVVRFGFDDIQHGADEVAAFRASVTQQSPPRTLERVTITTFGLDVAVVAAEFVPVGSEGAGVVGRQSQTWARFDGRWKVTHGHVSWLGGRAPTV